MSTSKCVCVCVCVCVYKTEREKERETKKKYVFYLFISFSSPKTWGIFESVTKSWPTYPTDKILLVDQKTNQTVLIRDFQEIVINWLFDWSFGNTFVILMSNSALICSKGHKKLKSILPPNNVKKFKLSVVKLLPFLPPSYVGTASRHQFWDRKTNRTIISRWVK